MKSKYLIKLASVIVCLSMIFGLMLPATAALDGYKPERNGNIVKILDFNNIAAIFSAGGLPSENAIGGDRYSLLWKNTSSKTSLSFYDIPRDWNDISEIRFSVYSPKVSEGTFSLTVHTDMPKGLTTTRNASHYQITNITTDHVGWKEFVFKKSEFNTYFSDWSKVKRLEFNPIVKETNANYCISSIYGVLGDPAPKLKLDATEKGKALVFETLGDNIAVMNFSNNVLKNGKILPLSVEDRITTDGSGRIAKFGFFTNVLGAKFDGEKTISLEGKTVDLTDMVISYDDGKFLPVEKVLTALGKTVKYKDMVTIIGDEEKTNRIFDDELLLDDLKFMLNVSVLTAEDITQEDWDKVKKQWREYIVGPPGNLNSPEKQEKIKSIDAAYQTAYKSINKDPNIAAFFGRNKAKTASSTISNLRKMALAYATEGSQYYKDPDARRIILEGLEWMYNNVYGPRDLVAKDDRTRVSTEEWEFHVGIPLDLTDTILLLGDGISKELAQKYLYIFEQSKSGANCGNAGRVYSGTLSAILNEDYDELLKRNSDYLGIMRSNPRNVSQVLRLGANEGVKEDGLFITHKYYPYTSGYGSAVLLDRLTPIIPPLTGTKFEFPNPYKYDPIMWIKDTFAPVIFNGAITAAMSGRFRADAQFSEPNYTRFVIITALDMLGCYGKDDDEFLKKFIKRNVVPVNQEVIRKSLSVSQLEKLNQIMADESIPVEPYYNSHVYYMGDTITHQRGNFGFAVAMSSSRIGAWEAITGQNITGWYQGDGMLYTYLRDDVAQYDLQYWKNVNPYHLPGTTVDTQERIPASVIDNGESRTNQHFVGGVQFDDDYSVAAMQLESHHNDNPNAVVVTTNPGKDFPHRECTLMAKKAWFLFDNEAVALGADIDADDGFEVQTVVENRKLNKTEEIIKEEVKVSDEIVEYKIVGVEASAFADPNSPQRSIDGKADTFWSIGGEGTITFELEKAVPVGCFAVAQYNGKGNKAIFDIEISADGLTWTEILANGKSSGETSEFEGYDMKGAVAKYIRYKGYGREKSEWNLIAEAKVFAPTKDGSSPISGLSTKKEENPEDSMIMGTEQIVVDGTLLEKASSYEKEFVNPTWAHIQNVGGYFFPSGGELKMHKHTNTLNFLEMWFTHGISPKGETYSYVVLPTMTTKETEEYSKNPDIEILSNTEKVQAVREKTLGLTGFVFWEAGKYDKIETSVPLIMMAKEKDDKGYYRLNISDPTQLLKEGKVTLQGSYELVDGDKRFEVSAKNNETVITINFDGSNGRTLPLTLLVK